MSKKTMDLAAVGPQARYFMQLDDGVFEIQRCGGCRRYQFYPRVLCQHCGVTDLSWVKPSGKGVVYSFSIIRRKPDMGGDYNVALIDLEEGVRLMSRIEGIVHDALRIGMAVSANILVEQEKGVLVFYPEGQK